MNIIGKLRLSQKNSKKFENPLPKNIKEEGPKGTYAFVESKEVIIKFNTKSSISSVYIKKIVIIQMVKPFIYMTIKMEKN